MGLEVATIAAISAGVSAAAATAGTVMSVRQANNAAKQAEMNADAEAKAIAQEKKRQSIEQAENQRRAAQQQNRMRAQQRAAMAGTGAMMGTGTVLDIEADTWAQQQLQLADQRYMFDLGQRQLTAQRTAVLDEGKAQASQIRGTRAGTVLSGMAQVASTGMQYFSTRPTTAKTQ